MSADSHFPRSSDSPEPSGSDRQFRKARPTSHPGYLHHGPAKVLLPMHLKQRIDAEREALHARRRAEEEEAAARRRVEEAEAAARQKAEWAKQSASENKRLGIPPDTSLVGTPARRRLEELDPALEALDLPVAFDSDFDRSKLHLAYDPLAPLALIRSTIRDKDIKTRNAELYLRLKDRGPLRHALPPPADGSGLASLQEAHPHFGAAIRFVQSQLHLPRGEGGTWHLPPILLSGPPGLGKTHFVRELAQVMGLPVHRESCDSDFTVSRFLGSDKKWGNSTCGFLFELLVMGETANPIVFLDELDKAQRRYDTDPLASLHSLLEPSTAAAVRDIAMDMEFDASRVIWLATANDPRRIPDSLRSRFREFEIEQPTGEDAIRVALAVVYACIDKLAPPGFEPPNRRLVVALAHLNAREIYQAVEAGIGHAVLNQRDHLLASDLPPDVQVDGPAGRFLH